MVVFNMDFSCLTRGIPLDPLPDLLPRDPSVPHAPVRKHLLSLREKKLAVKNALRYIPREFHSLLAREFYDELQLYGHIYMYRFRPTFPMRAYPIDCYPTKLKSTAAIMLMIMNNLDPAVAQFPHELVTYGGNGQVFSNWGQFWLVMKFLSEMEGDQTLVMYSGHPMGVFPSTTFSPRVVITNGMVIPNYSRKEDYDNMFALGVTMYGQMTAGSYCYIGPQGIVHGTTLTILNAGRKYLNLSDLRGQVFISSGLGGMSGAQPKAGVICDCIAVIAEVSYEALKKRYDQGWIQEMETDVRKLIRRIREAKHNKEVTSIGYHGNVVTLWEHLVSHYEETKELLCDLGSDQTSLHNPFNGGYYPVQLTYEEAQEMMARDPLEFKALVQESLRRQIKAIDILSSKGMRFWDYGNAFLLEAQRAGADVRGPESDSGLVFKYPSYVQDIMGDIFSLGFGPFRWVCASGAEKDLITTDHIATKVMEDIMKSGVDKDVKQQYKDNIRWIKEAHHHHMVVGSMARILYSDQMGRVAIALALNEAVRNGVLQGPVVISRDHHDVSGTDSPYRETSNVSDGSAFTADMAVQNFTGDSFRGATWVSLHNGGGCGWGEVINGGFGLVLDGSEEATERARCMLNWDVSNGVARRNWAGNQYAIDTINRAMDSDPKLKVLTPNLTNDSDLNFIV